MDIDFGVITYSIKWLQTFQREKSPQSSTILRHTVITIFITKKNYKQH